MYFNDETEEEFHDEDEYRQSLKRDEWYEFSFDYEYVADRFGEGDDDVTLETATLIVSLTWDDSSPPGYTFSLSVDSPTPIPNEWTGDAYEIFNDLWPVIWDALGAEELTMEMYKDLPL